MKMIALNSHQPHQPYVGAWRDNHGIKYSRKLSNIAANVSIV